MSLAFLKLADIIIAVTKNNSSIAINFVVFPGALDQLGNLLIVFYQSHSAVTPHSSIAANAIPGPVGASRVRVNGNYHQAMNSSNTGGAHNDYM
jgi:hypothetical protein